MDNQKENLFVPSDNQDDNIIMEMCIGIGIIKKEP